MPDEPPTAAELAPAFALPRLYLLEVRRAPDGAEAGQLQFWVRLEDRNQNAHIAPIDLKTARDFFDQLQGALGLHTDG